MAESNESRITTGLTDLCTVSILRLTTRIARHDLQLFTRVWHGL